MKFFVLFMLSVGVRALFLDTLSNAQAGWWMANFVQWLIDGGRAYSTIRVYLAAVSHLYRSAGMRAPTKHDKVARALRGAKKMLKSRLRRRGSSRSSCYTSGTPSSRP